MRGKVGREEQQVRRPTPEGETIAVGQGALWDGPALPGQESRLRGSDGVKNTKYFDVKTGNAFSTRKFVHGGASVLISSSYVLGNFHFSVSNLPESEICPLTRFSGKVPSLKTQR